MGFEYGYSVARPDALVLWEAQFGDFVNGAMTIVDEFIAAGRGEVGAALRPSLLLPHGYEGQGPTTRPPRARALPGDRRQQRLHGGPAVDTGLLLPPAAPAQPAREAPAADRLHAEVDAAQQGGGVCS
jgi:hypothetical protein